MNTSSANVDSAELAKFGELAQSWWDPRGPSRPLHDLNPVRLRYVERIVGGHGAGGAASGGLGNAKILDVGCGGGILAESMAQRQAEVLGIDLSPEVLEVAELHALEVGAAVKYRRVAVEELAAERPGAFDCVTCMEMLEHVPDPRAALAAMAKLVRPGGDLIVSTLNRNLRSFAVAIVGAEYVARMLPRGTHEYLKFIKPSELAAWGRSAELELRDLSGIDYNVLTRAFSLSADTRVNYLAHFKRPDTTVARE